MKHGYAIRIANCGNSVRDQDRRPAMHHLTQVVEDLFFSVGIHTGESVIEHEDAWIPNDRASNSGALFLSAAQGNAAFADHSVVLLRKIFNVGGDARSFSGSSDFIIGRVFDAKSDVLANGVT